MIAPERILFEDNHLLIINKRVGELVQGDQTGDVPLLEMAKAYIKEKYNKPGNVYLGVVHRIDRPVSGIVLFARTSKAASRLSDDIRRKAWKKTYLAVTQPWKAEPEGTLRHYLRKDAAKNKSFVVKEGDKRGKESILHYRLLGHLDRYSVLEVELETGRHHQIRCQLAATSSPIMGDLKYGAKRSRPDGGITLHARQLTLNHPVGKQALQIDCPLPASWPNEISQLLKQ